MKEKEPLIKSTDYGRDEASAKVRDQGRSIILHTHNNYCSRLSV